MRTRVLTVLTAISLLTAVSAPVVSAQQPVQDSVVGSATMTLYGQFDIDARSGSNGEDPVGQVTAIFNRFEGFSGPITCLAVRGNSATLNIDSNLGLITMQITDNAGTGSPDRIDAFPARRAPDDCSPFSGGVIGTVITGDIVVVDVPPVPTSKDQCKNGDWRNYAGFKNQGACVSFVATGDKRES